MYYDNTLDIFFLITLGKYTLCMTLLMFVMKLEEKAAKLTKKQEIAVLVTVLVSLFGVGFIIRKYIMQNSKIVEKIEATSDEELTTCEVTSTNGKTYELVPIQMRKDL